MKNELLPLSIGQKCIALARQLFPETPVNNIGGLILLEDNLDFDLLAKAIEICVQRNDAMRLRMYQKRSSLFKYEILINDIMQQYVSEEKKVEVGFHDFSSCTVQEMEDTILKWNSIPIDIFNSPLYEFKMIKTPDGRTGIFSKLDHLITDAWSSTLVCREIIEIYYALLRSEELPKPLYSFLDYLKSEWSYLGSTQYKADKDFWMKIYDTRPAYTRLREKIRQSKTGNSLRFNVKLDLDKSKTINNFCIQNRISPVTLFTFLSCMCISYFTGNKETNISSPIMTRSTIKEKKICGPIVNFQLARFFFDDNKTFINSCRELDHQRLAAMRHLRFPFLHLYSALFKKYFVGYFFDTMLAFPTARIETKEKIKFESKWLPSGVFANPFNLYILDIDNTGEYNLQYEYHTDTFNLDFVNEVHRNLMTFLDYGINKPSAQMKDMFQVP